MPFQRLEVVMSLLICIYRRTDMLGKEKLLFYPLSLLCISIGFSLFSVVLSQITLGSKLSVVENNYWVSSNGDFAIGFFNRSNQHSIGIRFNSNSIPNGKQTAIWVAGADLTVGNKSYFQLTTNGELVLFDSTIGVIAWTSNTTNSLVASAVLLDSGNFVLLNERKGIVWQSFDTPSDTLLPGQNLSFPQTLRAASRNSVSSFYHLEMNVSGQLQLKWESNVIYWTTPISSRTNLRATLSSDGTLRLFDQRSLPVWSVFGEDHSDSNVKFRFLRLDLDGNLRLYSWVEASRSWRTVWQAVDNQCNVFATCGLCGICVFNESGSALCKCPFKSVHESSSNCLVPYGQDCKSGSFLLTYEHTFLYGIYLPNETIIQTSLERCKSLCQKDPSCTAVTFTNDGTALCRQMTTKYVTGNSDPSLSSISFVKECSDPTAIFPLTPTSPSSSARDDPRKGSKGFCIPCLILVGLGTFVVFLVIQFGIGFCIYNRRKASLACKGPNANGLAMLSYPEIKDLTGDFRDKIGQIMFKGMYIDQRPVVVKDVKVLLTEERKFRSVVFKIGSIFHKHLVKLEGYCCESGHRFLVYEFFKNGSLGQCLEDPKICKRLMWKKRMEICLNVARAVSYLHTECREFISHGNLKCENVVLDDNLEPKVSEFGLGRRNHGEESDGGGEAEGDVRDFGKMALVLISGGCKDYDFFKWAYEKWDEGEAERVVDERLEGGVNTDELELLLRIIFWCLHFDPRMRPSMGEVVKVLEGNLSVDPPPSPFLSGRYEEEEESVESESE